MGEYKTYARIYYFIGKNEEKQTNNVSVHIKTNKKQGMQTCVKGKLFYGSIFKVCPNI